MVAKELNIKKNRGRRKSSIKSKFEDKRSSDHDVSFGKNRSIFEKRSSKPFQRELSLPNMNKAMSKAKKQIVSLQLLPQKSEAINGKTSIIELKRGMRGSNEMLLMPSTVNINQ
jgi:hypothetical protein